MSANLSRRGFLKTATAAALIVGFNPGGALATGTGPGVDLSPFVKVFPDGRVVAIVKHFEGGQGTATGLSALVAEELNMRLQDIGFEMAPFDNARYAHLFFGLQATGGSSSMANSYLQYRTAAAATREMLIAAAAKEWDLQADTLTLRDGTISGGGRSDNIGAFVEAASRVPVPDQPALKDPSDWRVLGVDQKSRLDTPAKLDGSARFSMDLQLDNQMVVAIRRTPRLGGRLAWFDAAAAEAIPGFIMAKPLPDGKGVMVYAETTWAAFQARDALSVEWDLSSAESRSHDALKEELLSMVRAEPEFQASETDLETTSAALEGAAQIIEREFYFPILAHGPMEPVGAAIEPLADGGVVLHDGAQAPAAGNMMVSQILDLPAEKVQINTLYAGGFFGRRSTPDFDYLVETAQAFAATDRTRPVKLQCTREDDITGGYYRPAYAHRVRVGLDDDGNIIGWDHRLAGQSIFKDTPMEQFLVRGGVDATSVEGVHDTPYRIPVLHVGLTDQKGPTTANWWRSVGHSHTGYVMECMMDECARVTNQDPVAFRLNHLTGNDPDQARMAGVIRLVSDKARWGKPLPDGHFHGVAAHKSFNTYVAQICEISVDEDNVITIERVTAAVDCGVPVTPDIIRAQIEGGIGYGFGHVMRAGITLTNGEVDQSNFHDFETLRIYDLSKIDVHIVPSAAPPTGVGEPGTPPAGPALANAIAASGQPLVTHLPMTASGIKFS
ncbi:MAG: molybdopterin-dependent oxidoreductase [Alphaproteobacteria bacterium]|nr:molybdopterin-dependent oxidoreductase [Alphaproteobacteria bacterium]